MPSSISSKIHAVPPACDGRKGPVGIDLDNTIICYDVALIAGARELNVPIQSQASKREIRNGIRLLPDGETKWQELQAYIYGPGISSATVADGVLEFLRLAHANSIQLFVISHKTEFASAAPHGPNLRTAALTWLEQNNLFADDTGLSPERIYFTATRAEKIETIFNLGCIHFIDDLEETFVETGHLADLECYLYRPGLKPRRNQPWHEFESWRALVGHFETLWK